MALKPEYLTLTKLLENRLFSIPEYQRAYSWKTQQRNELFEDIKKILDAYDINKSHFMATVVCLQTNVTEEVGTDELERLDIVDGQQRLTTLIILMKAIAIRLENLEGIDYVEAKKLNNLLVKDNGRLILLQTNHVSKIIFCDYLKNGKVDLNNNYETQAEKNICDAIKECNILLDELSTTEKILKLLKVIKNRLNFIFYVLEDEGAVYTVFEVLNSRGLPVAWLDKCKSMLMGAIFEKCTKQVASDKMILMRDIWGAIYISLGSHIVKDDEVLAVSATLDYDGSGTIGKPLSVEKAVAYFKEKAYQDPDNCIQISKWISNVASELVKLYSEKRLNAVTDISHARMLAIAIRLSDSYTLDEKSEMLKEWEKVTFLLFGLHRKDSRFRVGDYVRVARRIRKGEVDFDGAIKEIKAIANKFTIDAAITNLMGEDWYGSYDNDLKYLLFRYEEYLAKNEGEKISKETWDKIWSESPAKTIEHIHPKTYIDTWKGKIGNSQEEIEDIVHTLGNLVMLPPGMNSECGQKIFSEKKEKYKKQSLFMLREIESLDDWNKKTIEDRELKILDFIKFEWGQK